MFKIGSLILGNVAFGLFHSGISNILGLETLKHGTNPINNLKIRVFGGDPSHGHKASGSTKGWRTYNTKNYFYLTKDSEFNIDNLVNDPIAKMFATGIGHPILTRKHAAVSGYNFVAQVFSNIKNKSILINFFSIFLSCISGTCSLLISPTLRFRFSEIDSNRFENDPDYHGMAYRTKQVVEPWRLGLLGSLLVGINLSWFSRIKAKPLKVLTGIVQLTFSVAFTILFAKSLLASPALVIAGALLA